MCYSQKSKYNSFFLRQNFILTLWNRNSEKCSLVSLFVPLQIQSYSWSPALLFCHRRVTPLNAIFGFLRGYSHSYETIKYSVQFSSVAQSCLTLWDPMNCSITNSWSSLGLTSIKSVMPSSHLILCFLLLLLPPNPSQHQGLFQWVNTSHEVARVLELQPQHQSFQWTPRTGLL